MTWINFYNKTPSAAQVASHLSDDELTVFNHTTTGARYLDEQVQALVDFDFNTHNENTIPKWGGPDYFVMARSSFGYHATREKLRKIAVEWDQAGCPDQIKRI